MKPKKLSLMILVAFCMTVTAGVVKRDRGDNLFRTLSANTLGKGNVWVEVGGTGFIWDNDAKLRLFPQMDVRWGILNFLQARVFSRILTYGFQPGYLTPELKITIPNNQNIRLYGIGLALQYEVGLMNELKGTAGGYRDPDGATGFSPEGFLFEKGTTNILLLNEFDLTSISSWLPFSFFINTGYAMAHDAYYRKFNQSLWLVGVKYQMDIVDFFLEANAKTFNNFGRPLLSDILPTYKRYLVYFPENEWYITPGARIHYEGGLTLWGAVSIRPAPLVINVGSSFEAKRAWDLPQEERDYGATDGYSPFFTDWMVHVGVSYPIRYRQPSAELYRGFLLKKNIKRKKVIDIDEKLKTETVLGDPDSEEDKKRLQEIENRKKKVMNETVLD